MTTKFNVYIDEKQTELYYIFVYTKFLRKVFLLTKIHSKDDGGIRTKKQFANAILSLSEIMPIQKIRISDICEKCGLKRQSFYYHFKDKYDLIAWLFVQEYGSVAAGHKIINSEEMMLHMLLLKIYQELWINLSKK